MSKALANRLWTCGPGRALGRAARVLAPLALVAAVLASGIAAAWAQQAPKPGRLPVPAAPEVEKAEALVRDVYKGDLAAADTPSKQLDLARRLVDEAAKTDDDPAARFALLKMAQQTAVEAGDAALLVQCIDEAARHFDFDARAARQSALMKAAGNPRNSAVARSLAEACQGLLDQAVKADDFELAMDYGRAAYAAAGGAKDPAFVAEIVARGRQVVALRAEHEKAAEALKTLAQTPDDPAANLTAGRYACLVKEDWRRGLPMLAKGGDADLKAAAEKDLADPTDAPGQLAAADAWWDLGQKADAPEKDALLRRAAHWYRRAQPQATGLDKAKATSRLAEVRGFAKVEKPQAKPEKPTAKPAAKPGQAPHKTLDEAEGKYADVLKEIDLKKNRIAGDWQFKAGKLLGAPGAGAAAAGVAVPVAPNGAYDLKIEFTRTAGDGMIGVILPVGGRRCLAGLDCRPGIHGIDTIEGQRADNNSSTARGALNTNRQYALEINVAVDDGEASVTVNLDDRPLFFYRGPAKDLDLHKDFVSKNQAGIGLVARCGIVLHSVKLRMKTGKAVLLH